MDQNAETSKVGLMTFMRLRENAELCRSLHFTASYCVYSDCSVECASISLADTQKKRLAEFLCLRASEWTNLAGGAAGRGGEDD